MCVPSVRTPQSRQKSRLRGEESVQCDCMALHRLQSGASSILQQIGPDHQIASGQGSGVMVSDVTWAFKCFQALYPTVGLQSEMLPTSKSIKHLWTDVAGASEALWTDVGHLKHLWTDVGHLKHLWTDVG